MSMFRHRTTVVHKLATKPLVSAKPTTRVGNMAETTTRSYSLFQKRLQDPRNTSNFAGKTVLVTGSNTGLGFEAALKIASLRAKHLILGVRDLEKGENAKQRILKRIATSEVADNDGNNNQRISVRKLDMSDYDSIQTFVRQIGDNKDTRDEPLLDVAILNAGIFSVRHETPGKYGWETDLQVNVLSTALLALLLIRSQKLKPGSGVLEFVASRRMQAVKLTEQELRSSNLLESFNRKHEEKFDASRQYQASKLLLMAFFRALATKSGDLAPHESPIITAICPGFCQSDLSRGHQGVVADVLRAILNTFVLRSTEEGARALVSGAVAERERHGRFWFDDELHDV